MTNSSNETRQACFTAMKPWLGYCLWFCALILGQPVWAGGSGLNTIVVINQNSTNSLQLGNDYCELRGVPPQNVLKVTGWTGGSISWTPTQFTNYLLNPLLTLAASRGLTNQAQFVLLSMDIPYRVTDGSNVNSTTAALYYGFKTNGAPVIGISSCSLPDASFNSYVYSELPFSQASPDTASTNAFLAMMLTDTNLAQAEITLRHGVAGDSTFPTQPVYLEETTDPARNVRFLEADNAVFENQVAGNYAVTRITANSTLYTNIFGFQTGLATFSLHTNTFAAGALGDSLTSFGGYILENSGQTPLLAFVEAGAAGSYGTVVEPCNYLQKFPDPLDYFYQTRGFSLAEAYYQSVQNPFQGLMVGEPLSAPFARPGTGVWNAPANGATISGNTTLSLSFTGAATNLPLAQAELFVDGTFFGTMTNLPPTPGNQLAVTLNGDTIAYTIQPDDTLATAAEGLADELNLQTNETQVVAYPVGDRVELLSQALYVPGSNVTLSASASLGSAARLTTGLSTPRPAFLDTVATGYHYVLIQNSPVVGDWLQLTVIKTNGVVVTVGVTNTVSGTSLSTLVQDLINVIAATPALETPDGLVVENFISGSPAQFFLFARTPGCAAAQILATLNTSADLVQGQPGTFPLADNITDLLPRNHLYLSAGTNVLTVNYGLDTTQLADGWHQLTAVAYEGTSVATQTRVTETVLVQNTTLSATLASLPAGTAASLIQPLQFTVTANSPNIALIQLFATGGPAAAVTNLAGTTFTLAATNLGLGLHPFYALVTDQSGHRYQTQTEWYRILPVNNDPATPVIVWPDPAPIAYGTALGTSQLDATASVPGTFAYTPAAGTILGAGTNPLTAVFTPEDTVDYLSATNQVSLVVTPMSLVSSEHPSGFQDGVTFTAETATTATGNVVFLTNGVPFDTVAIPGNGRAVSAAITTLPRGTNTITAEYAGDSNDPGSTNTLDQVVTNHPPVAGVYTVSRTPGTKLHILWSDVSSVWSDLDGDALSVAWLSLVTTNGITVQTNSQQILYFNAANVNDQLTYAITDGYGGFATNVINLTVNPFTTLSTGQNTPLTVISGGSTTVSFYGIIGLNYEIQRSTDLINWVTISTQTVGATGSISFTDTFADLSSPPASAYYRLAWQP